MRHPILFPLVAILALTAAAAPVRSEEPVITIRKSDTVAITIDAFSGPEGSISGKVVANDLDLSGVFAIGREAPGGFRVSGRAAPGSLDGTVTDARGDTVLRRTYRGDTREAAHKFSDDIVETLTGKPGIATSKFVFVSNRSGTKEIYLADYDGANRIQLTRDRSISVAPAISPDGLTMAYTGYQRGYADIYRVNLASGARHRIVKFPGTNSGACFSPDGGRIACTISRDGNPELYIVGANGSGARRLTRSRGVESSPTWSPDGNEIIYSSDEPGSPRLYRISSGGGRPIPVPVGFSYCTEPSWSPDGRRIALTVRQGGFSIAVLELGSANKARVLARGQDPCWGADSRHILYSTGDSIVLMDTLKGRQTTVVSGMGRVSEPSWSR
jgi:TolB protein